MTQNLWLMLAGLVAHSVNTEYEWLISAPANVCMLVCVFTSAVIIATYWTTSLVQMNVYIFYI